MSFIQNFCALTFDSKSNLFGEQGAGLRGGVRGGVWALVTEGDETAGNGSGASWNERILSVLYNITSNFFSLKNKTVSNEIWCLTK